MVAELLDGSIPAGAVPGLPEWEFFFHGMGCRLAHKVTGEGIETETGEGFDFFFWIKTSFRPKILPPSPADDRIAHAVPVPAATLAELRKAGVIDADREAVDRWTLAEEVARFEPAALTVRPIGFRTRLIKCLFGRQQLHPVFCIEAPMWSWTIERRPQGQHRAAWLMPLWPFVFAAVMVALMAGLRFLLDPILEENHPFALFLAAGFVTAWCADWKAGSLALVLGLLAADFLFTHPRYTVGHWSAMERVGLTIYALIGAGGIVLIEALKTARQRAEAQALRLRDEIAEHQRTQQALLEAKTELEKRVDQRTTELIKTSDDLRQEEGARRAAEAKVQRLATLVAWSEDAIIGLDPNCVVTDWNIGAEHLFGIPAAEIVGRSIFVLVPPDDRDRVDRKLEGLRRGEQIKPYEAVRLRKEGGGVAVSVRSSTMKDAQGRLIGFSLIYRDLTDAKRLEDQLRQSQKMEAVGQLAGGVAHDFNNLLTVINGYSEIILDGLRRDDPTRNLVQQIYDAGGRAASLTQQLLAFSRKQVLQPKVIDLNETVRHSEKLLGRLIGEDVRLTAVLGPNLGHVKVDPGQMEQVVINLAVNARDAMPQGGQIDHRDRQSRY